MLLCAFSLFNVQLLLLSGIGTPYDPADRQGRRSGATSRIRPMSGAIGFFDKDKFNFNPFVASGAIGMCIDEFNGDNFDHGPLGFVGGGYIGQVQTNGRPIESIGGAARHAGLGRAMEAGAARQLSQHDQSPAGRATAPSTAIATSISISIRPTRTASAGR